MAYTSMQASCHPPSSPATHSSPTPPTCPNPPPPGRSESHIYIANCNSVTHVAKCNSCASDALWGHPQSSSCSGNLWGSKTGAEFKDTQQSAMEHPSPGPRCSAPGVHLVAKAATLLTTAVWDPLRIPYFNLFPKAWNEGGGSKQRK